METLTFWQLEDKMFSSVEIITDICAIVDHNFGFYSIFDTVQEGQWNLMRSFFFSSHRFPTQCLVKTVRPHSQKLLAQRRKSSSFLCEFPAVTTFIDRTVSLFYFILFLCSTGKPLWVPQTHWLEGIQSALLWRSHLQWLGSKQHPHMFSTNSSFYLHRLLLFGIRAKRVLFYHREVCNPLS